jgi:SAM-dependent methyltransferase
MNTNTSQQVQGTTGYAAAAARFLELSESIEFQDLHKDFLDLLPEPPAYTLDIGTGSGRDAGALADLGHTVVAIEPTAAFLQAARHLHPHPAITWHDDSLPSLPTLMGYSAQFDFILASAVWQHLEPCEQPIALANIYQLLKPNGVFLVSLRHGPAGLGTHSFPCDPAALIKDAETLGLILQRQKYNQPSALPNKSEVTWTRLAFAKPALSVNQC